MLSFCLFTDQYLYLILKEIFYNLFMNVLKCHSGINESLTGLKRHGEQMMTTFVFLEELSLYGLIVNY